MLDEDTVIHTVQDKIGRNKTADRSLSHSRLDELCGQVGQFPPSELEVVKHTVR